MSVVINGVLMRHFGEDGQAENKLRNGEENLHRSQTLVESVASRRDKVEDDHDDKIDEEGDDGEEEERCNLVILVSGDAEIKTREFTAIPQDQNGAVPDGSDVAERIGWMLRFFDEIDPNRRNKHKEGKQRVPIHEDSKDGASSDFTLLMSNVNSHDDETKN